MYGVSSGTARITTGLGASAACMLMVVISTPSASTGGDLWGRRGVHHRWEPVALPTIKPLKRERRADWIGIRRRNPVVTFRTIHPMMHKVVRRTLHVAAGARRHQKRRMEVQRMRGRA